MENTGLFIDYQQNGMFSYYHTIVCVDSANNLLQVLFSFVYRCLPNSNDEKMIIDNGWKGYNWSPYVMHACVYIEMQVSE